MTMTLRVIKDETPPLSDDELREKGNVLSRAAKRSAVEAVRLSMIPEFLERGQITVAGLKRWRDRARTARAAWAEVEALTDELIREVEKNRAAKR